MLIILVLFGVIRNCEAFGSWVRSNVMVGNGAEAEMVAMLGEHRSKLLAKKFVLIIPSALVIDPDNSIFAAADVVATIAIAAGGNGWV